jgi:hypothetical protein
VQKALEQFLHPETRLLLDELQASTGSRFRKLNEAISQLIDDWSMISFSPLDYSEEDSIAYVLSQVLNDAGLAHLSSPIHERNSHQVAHTSVAATLLGIGRGGRRTTTPLKGQLCFQAYELMVLVVVVLMKGGGLEITSRFGSVVTGAGRYCHPVWRGCGGESEGRR